MFKAILFSLLAANAIYLLLGGSISKAVDAGAWLILLVLFEIETRFGARLITTRRRRVLHLVRLTAGIGVIGATIGYVFEKDVLDAVNSGLWIAVVVLLEIEVRYRFQGAGSRAALSVVAACLYGALATLVVIWAMRREWFDAYDALLWLIAFMAIELELLSRKTRAAAQITL